MNAGELPAAAEGRNPRRGETLGLRGSLRTREREDAAERREGQRRARGAGGGQEGCGGMGACDFTGGREEDGARRTAAARSGVGLGARNGARPL
jgi:hypothetical protein